MNAPLNPDLVGAESPPIPQVRSWVDRYDGAEGKLIDLSQAVPHVPPPPEMLARLAKAAGDSAVAAYGPIEGETAFREAFARDVSDAYAARDVRAGNVAITSGCNQAFVIVAMALAKAGEQIILPSPWYFNHKMALDMLGVEARSLPCRAQDRFVPSPEDAARLIDERTRAIVLITPNNPTGAIYPPETIGAFADLCRARNIWLVLDETYREFLPSGVGRPHAVFSRSGWSSHVIQIYSFSKSYAIPGYRLGAVLAASEVVRQISKTLDALQICPPRVGQIAAAWAVEALRDWRSENRAAINARAKTFHDVMASLPGWRTDSLGAYFAFVQHPFAGVAAERVAEILAVKLGVLTLPGSYFGPDAQSHLRVAFANAPEDRLEELPTRLRRLKSSAFEP